MAQTQKTRMNLNRVLAFIAGGLLVFGVMSLTVVSNVRTENEELTDALDTSRYEAGRLLADAQAQYDARDYQEAVSSLESLIENQPGSPEAVEGRDLLATIETARAEADARWNAAMPALREAWLAETAVTLRAEWDADRARLEASIQDSIEEAWEETEPEIRTDWEIQESLEG
jgi:predicted Zn-dependent protease